MNWEKLQSRIKDITIESSECTILAKGHGNKSIPYFLLHIKYSDFMSYKPHRLYYNGYRVKLQGFAPADKGSVLALYRPIRDINKEGEDDLYTLFYSCG